MDVTDGGGIFNRYIKDPLNREKLVYGVTHLTAPGRQGLRLTSSVALKDLKSRDRQLEVQTEAHRTD